LPIRKFCRTYLAKSSNLFLFPLKNFRINPIILSRKNYTQNFYKHINKIRIFIKA